MTPPDIVYGLVSENHKVERRILISRTLQVYRLTTRRFHIASTGSFSVSALQSIPGSSSARISVREGGSNRGIYRVVGVTELFSTP